MVPLPIRAAGYCQTTLVGNFPPSPARPLLFFRHASRFVIRFLHRNFVETRPPRPLLGSQPASHLIHHPLNCKMESVSCTSPSPCSFRSSAIFCSFAALTGLLAAQDPGLSITLSSDKSVTLRATGATTTVRAVWETTSDLQNLGWQVFEVQPITRGQAELEHSITLPAAFFRVTLYETPGYNDRIGALLARTQITHPEAQLLESNPLISGTLTAFPEAPPIRVVLRVNGGTLILTETDPSQPPQEEFVSRPWLGSQTLPWPILMDVLEAESLFRAAGYGPEYRSVTLRQPVYPGMVEPYFIFGTTAGKFIFVGTESRTVFIGT